MYVNQIDNIIDKILDKLYLSGLTNDPTFKKIVDEKKINYVEYREQINAFIQSFMDDLDITEIQKLINNKENIKRIVDIIKRYIAYYYFLSIAFYYTGSIKDFRNNLIQYSKLQENSVFTIRNFFDTENNYQLVNFFKIVKETSNIIVMTDLQKKTLNPLEIKETIKFLNSLGKNYIDNYLLVSRTTQTGETVVEINVHNLIKTIVFGEIYRNQEQRYVFEILNDIQESETEYIYIDVVVSTDELTDFNSFRQIFLGEENNEVMAKDLFELVTESNRISSVTTIDKKNNNLLALGFIIPIVDDFVRYHRDSERLDTDSEKAYIVPFTSNNNAKNIQLALLYQQRKKKENTKAHLIVNKIDAVSDLYSENVKNNPEVAKDIKKYFQGPLSYRKAVLINYLDEIHVMNKIINQGHRAMEENEYFLELKQINNHAYFNFKDFQKYGTMVNLEIETPINLLRYSNIEFNSLMPYLELDMHTGVNDEVINLVGFAVGPFTSGPIQCIKKENLVDIRNIKFHYFSNNQVKESKSENGYKLFLKIIKHFIINTITIKTKPRLTIIHDFTEMKKINPSIYNKVIYWIYNPEKDEYKMDTYENIKSYNFQENIKFMNSKIYDDVVDLLYKKLISLIDTHRDLSLFKMQLLIELYTTVVNLSMGQNEKHELLVREYLRKLPPSSSLILEIAESDKIKIPEFEFIPDKSVFRIRIDMVNPLNVKEYIKLEAYTGKEVAKIDSSSPMYKHDSKCQHELEWLELQKLKREELNKYNMAVTQFIEKYALESLEFDYVCKICGQLLPLKQYIQDGSFDNNTQKFVAAYNPIDIPLEELKEYRKYELTIKYLDGLINRVSMITGTNVFIGSTTQTRQKRKALIKNIIDIIVKHNSVNLRKQQTTEEREDFFSKKFNINKDLDSIFFFELEDSIFSSVPISSSGTADLNRLKFNNILLYFILIFITELNGSQIAMMHYDKFANIYTYEKYGPKLFGDLLIKKNVNDMETVPIINYPILCYLIFLISYFLIKYKLWYHSSSASKSFDPIIQKSIIHSFADFFNGISMDTGKIPNDYVYLLTTSKLYSQLNGTFKNTEIVRLLRRNQSKYSTQQIKESITIDDDLLKTYYIKNPIKEEIKPIKIPSFKISSGIFYGDEMSIHYIGTDHNTNITNCKIEKNIGGFHSWSIRGTKMSCTYCGVDSKEVDINYDSTTDSYYFNLQKIANKRCLTGRVHDFVGKNGKFVCTFCGHGPNDIYTRDELNTLAKNLIKINEENTEQMYKSLLRQIKEMEDEAIEEEAISEKIYTGFKKESNVMFGKMNILVDNFITVLEKLIGPDINLNIDKYPVYLRDDIYVVDHAYDGAPFPQPIILTQTDNRVIFKEDHPFFKSDVYYYTDNRVGQIDVFYHAVTLQLLGYKEKHKDYVLITKSKNYLKINNSIRNRLLLIGYETKYIDIGDIYHKSKTTEPVDSNPNKIYYQILDNLIRDHIIRFKSITDKIISMLYSVKNYQPTQSEEPLYLHTKQDIDKLIIKFGKLIREPVFGENNRAFDSWNIIRNLFPYHKVDWEKTNIKFIPENMFVNSEIINYYDTTSNLIMYYLTNELISIIDSNKERITKINISQLFIEVINYIYELYNTDRFKNSMDLKRFNYIVDGSDVMIDLLKKGQGLDQSRQLEEQLDDTQPDLTDLAEVTGEGEELEDLREEAEALDVEAMEWEEENEEYAEGADHEE